MKSWAPAQAALENEGVWERVDQSEGLPYLPNNPEYADKILVTIHAYRVLE